MIVRTQRGEYIAPRRNPSPGEHLSDYLFVRHGIFHGEGMIMTSTILAPRDLFLRYPFEEHTRRLHETLWLLRLYAEEAIYPIIVTEVLAIWHADENRPRKSPGKNDWAELFEWIKENRRFFTPRAYAAFIMSILSDMAAHRKNLRVFWIFLQEALRNGRPGLLDFVIFLNIWLVPQALRRKIRDFSLKWISPVSS